MTDSFQHDRPIICPYDSNHSIAASRIQKHLVKCSRNFPPDYKVSCPYNATHRLFRSEVQEHISTCADHQHVDPMIYEMYQKRGAAMSSVASESQSIVDCQESWDDDDESNFYPIVKPPDCRSATPLDSVGRANTDHSFSMSTEDVPKIPLLMRKTRAPSGLAEALMIEESGESVVDETGSVASFMGIGRAKLWNQPRNEIVQKIGRARGSSQANKRF